MPASRRIVVPERAQLSGAFGARRPYSPRPWMVSAVWLCLSISTPSARRQVRVVRQSLQERKPLIRLAPVAKAPSNSARCEMDLSPGILSRPRNGGLGCTVNRRIGLLHGRASVGASQQWRNSHGHTVVNLAVGPQMQRVPRPAYLPLPLAQLPNRVINRLAHHRVIGRQLQGRIGVAGGDVLQRLVVIANLETGELETVGG
jgi:hypothetical protein